MHPRPAPLVWATLYSNASLKARNYSGSSSWLAGGAFSLPATTERSSEASARAAPSVRETATLNDGVRMS